MNMYVTGSAETVRAVDKSINGYDCQLSELTTVVMMAWLDFSGLEY